MMEMGPSRQANATELAAAALSAVIAIRDHLQQQTHGWSNQVAAQDIEGEIVRILAVEPYASEAAYLNERVAALRGWLDVLFSERKHLKYGGSDQVKVFVLSELGKIDKWLHRPELLQRA